MILKLEEKIIGPLHSYYELRCDDKMGFRLESPSTLSITKRVNG